MVKYRSRWRPGHPNWAAILFRGKENEVFQQQPICFHYHWMEQPEEIWPYKIQVCHDEPYMYCSDAYYCAFTLNPILMSKKFWLEEYMDALPQWKVHDPYQNLEYYFNWEPGAWNDRGWTVAQGDGLFRHEDAEKWGQ